MDNKALVTLIRQAVESFDDAVVVECALLAADEIERLQAQLATCRDSLEHSYVARCKALNERDAVRRQRDIAWKAWMAAEALLDEHQAQHIATRGEVIPMAGKKGKKGKC